MTNFICCNNSNKMIQEREMDIFFNIDCKKYPKITLSYAFNCECNNIYAHNICLLNMTECPNCKSKVIKPNLLVKTKLDNYFYYFFEFLKKCPSLIKTISDIIIFIIIFFLKILVDIVDTHYKTSILVLAIIIFLNKVLTEFKQYLKYYWLWDGNKIQGL